MTNQQKMDYLTGCYENGAAKERGMCAIQAFVLAGEVHLSVPEWAMQEVGQRFNAYWRANTAEGVKKQLPLDSFFETQRKFQPMKTNERDDEQVRRVFHFEKIFGLNRSEAITVLEAAELMDIVTKEGHAEDDKHRERRGKAHVINRKEATTLHGSYSNLFENRIADGSIDFATTAQQVFDSLPSKAQNLVKNFQRKK